MTDFEERVRRGLSTVARTVPIGPATRRQARGRPHRAPLLSVAAALAAIAVPLAVIAAMHGRSAPVGPTSQTTSVPVSPSLTRSGSGAGPPSQVVVPRRIQVLAQQVAERMLGVQGLYPGPMGPHTLWLCQMGFYGNDGPRTLYAEVLCASYSTGPRARMKSGIQLPMVLHVRGAGAGTRLVSFDYPRQGTYVQDLKRIFPPRILAKINDVKYSLAPLPTQEQMLAVARAAGSTP
jgi:hypothetical protein